jgi:hypothetical protein
MHAICYLFAMAPRYIYYLVAYELPWNIWINILVFAIFFMGVFGTIAFCFTGLLSLINPLILLLGQSGALIVLATRASLWFFEMSDVREYLYDNTVGASDGGAALGLYPLKVFAYGAKSTFLLSGYVFADELIEAIEHVEASDVVTSTGWFVCFLVQGSTMLLIGLLFFIVAIIAAGSNFFAVASAVLNFLNQLYVAGAYYSAAMGKRDTQQMLDEHYETQERVQTLEESVERLQRKVDGETTAERTQRRAARDRGLQASRRRRGSRRAAAASVRD